jgi:hypothetical protein
MEQYQRPAGPAAAVASTSSASSPDSRPGAVEGQGSSTHWRVAFVPLSGKWITIRAGEPASGKG